MLNMCVWTTFIFHLINAFLLIGFVLAHAPLPTAAVKMEKFEWTAFLKFTFLNLKIIGLWPEDEDYKINLYGIWSMISIVFFRLGNTLLQIVILFTFTDIDAMMAIAYIILSEFLATMKACLMVKNMKVLKQLLASLDTKPFQPRNERQIEEIQPLISFWKWNNNIYWFAVTWTLFFLATYPIFDGSFKRKQLPFISWFPFNTKTSPNYELTYLYQFVGMILNGNTAMTVDTLIAALHVYIASQFDILCDDLKHLDNGKNGHRDLVSCFKHHRKILKFAEDSAKFTNWIVLGQFFLSGLAIGITLFHMTTVVLFSSEYFSIIGYLIAVIHQIFIYCYFGNDVQIKSNKIPYALFESDWPDSSSEVKKEMIIMIENCQKPLKVSALNLFYLSLDTFMMILRAAWSYFALLHQLTSGQ